MQFTAVSAHDGRVRARIASAGLLYETTQLRIPRIAFDDVDPAPLALPNPLGPDCPQRILPVPEAHRLRIADAIAHPPFGIVTIDAFVLRETLDHVPFNLPGYGRVGDCVTLPSQWVSQELAHPTLGASFWARP